MRKEVCTIGVLTSGGDAPGMNAAVRAVVRTALYHDIHVKGIYHGYAGLLEGHIRNLSLRSVSNIMETGGTMLYSARSPEFYHIENVRKGVLNCRAANIDGLVVIGGDGSFRGAKALSDEGIPCVGIPGTIDNDIASTDYTLGFDTAVNTVVENVDRLRDTTQSHARCSVVEVMGRHCGDIALHSAICTGAVSVLIPEIEFSIDKDVIDTMKKTLSAGKNHFIVMMAEGVTGNEFTEDEHLSAAMLAKYIQDKTGVQTRSTVLGHIQRGGRPTARDRVLAASMGSHAVRLLRDGNGSRVVGERNNTIVDFEITEALAMEKNVDWELFRVAKEISL